MFSKERRQGSGIDGLEEKVVASGFACPAAIRLPTVTGDGDDGERPMQFPAEGGGDLITVEVGQADIEQHDVGSLATSDLDGLITVAGDLDMVAEAHEPPGHALGGISVVIDDEDIGHCDLVTGGEH